MSKNELINKLDEILAEIPLLEWCKAFSLEYLWHLKNEHKEQIKEVNYKLFYDTAWNLPIKSETFNEAVKRLSDHLPIFEKYFIYIYSLYEGYLENKRDVDKDKKDLALLKYRIFRNIISHNLGIVQQKHINEFDKKVKEYNQNLKQDDLENLFNYRSGANIRIFDSDLTTLINLIKKKV